MNEFVHRESGISKNAIRGAGDMRDDNGVAVRVVAHEGNDTHITDRLEEELWRVACGAPQIVADESEAAITRRARIMVTFVRRQSCENHQQPEAVDLKTTDQVWEQLEELEADALLLVSAGLLRGLGFSVLPNVPYRLHRSSRQLQLLLPGHT